MSRPKAVIISDTHYSLATRDLADKAWRMAVDKAAELQVPLVDAGDITNDKAILRAEVISTMIETMKYAGKKGVLPYLIVGNHSLVNEKADAHALEFLRPYAIIIDRPTYVSELGAWLLPYFSDLDKLKSALSHIPMNSTIIMHQGVDKAWGGHYVHDKTAAPAEWFKDYRVISGHYHRAQDVKCGRPRKGAVGLFSYVGNPYTLTFGEANDGPKGFRILRDDGALEFADIKLRRHRVLEMMVEEVLDYHVGAFPSEDLLWVKVTGSRSELAKIDKEYLGKVLGAGSNFKLDLIPLDGREQVKNSEDKLTGLQILDKLIEGLLDGDEYKNYLKGLTQEVLE